MKEGRERRNKKRRIIRGGKEETERAKEKEESEREDKGRNRKRKKMGGSSVSQNRGSSYNHFCLSLSQFSHTGTHSSSSVTEQLKAGEERAESEVELNTDQSCVPNACFG